jgi:hypothetical protein
MAQCNGSGDLVEVSLTARRDWGSGRGVASRYPLPHQRTYGVRTRRFIRRDLGGMQAEKARQTESDEESGAVRLVHVVGTGVLPGYSPPAILLRESFRDGDKVRKRTVANLSNLPAPTIEALRRVLRGEAIVRPVGRKKLDAIDLLLTVQGCGLFFWKKEHGGASGSVGWVGDRGRFRGASVPGGGEHCNPPPSPAEYRGISPGSGEVDRARLVA